MNPAMVSTAVSPSRLRLCRLGTPSALWRQLLEAEQRLMEALQRLGGLGICYISQGVKEW